MPDLHTIRRDNLALLLQQFVHARVAQGSSPKGLEQEFAAQLQVSPSMLSQLKGSRNIGDKLARQVEGACRQAAGWLDEEHRGPAEADPREERFVELARAAWRNANAQGKRELMRALKAAQAHA